MNSHKKKEIATNYLHDIFKNNKNLSLLKAGKLSIENEFLSKKNINIWNKTETSFDCFIESIFKYYDEKSMIFLWHIGKIISEKENEINLWNEEFLYFKKKFLWEIEKQYNKFTKKLKIENKNRQVEIEKQRMDDISTGIFSTADAFSRSIFFNTSYSSRSNEFTKIYNELNYKSKQGISFIYLKLEEICFIAYSLTNTRTENQKLYLWEKFESFKLIKEFKDNLIENDEIIIKEIMNFANHYKHQTEIKFELDVGKIKEFLALLDKLFNLLNDLFDKLKPFCTKAINVYEEYESSLNPLGLTGFEID